MPERFATMFVTNFFEINDPTLVRVPEVTNAEYSMFNDGSVECEVGEFLYGLVRMIKPDYVLESGTYKGVSASYIGQALKDNKKGLLTTIEIEKQHIRFSEARFDRLGIHEYICVDKEISTDYDVEYDCDIMFLDTEPYLRFKELRRYFPKIKPGGFVFIHDMPRNLCQGNVNPDHPEYKSWPVGEIPREVCDWVLDNELVPFHFDTPRGLLGFYKRHPDDFKFGRI